MLLSHRHKFLFVHITKTGGTSIRDALKKSIRFDPWRLAMIACGQASQLTGYKLLGKFPRHAGALAAQEMLPNDFFQSLFKFTIVRNPWDRMVSTFFHLHRECPELRSELKDFEAFISRMLVEKKFLGLNIEKLFRTQIDHLVDRQGDVIVDYIGHFEKLKDEFSTITERVGIRAKLPHKRESVGRKDYRSYYNDKTAAIVADFFAEDVERLNYSFDPK